jgi:hypothetical protein
MHPHDQYADITKAQAINLDIGRSLLMFGSNHTLERRIIANL